MAKHLYSKIILVLTLMIYASGCTEKTFKPCTVPSVISLNKPVLNSSSMSVTLSAVYNGDDEGIADAWFSVYNAEDPEKVDRLDCKWEDGKAVAVTQSLETGNDYEFNFQIITIGGNTIRSDAAEKCSMKYPDNFRYSTSNTNTAKVFEISYSGSDQFVSSATLIVRNSENVLMENAPEVFCNNGSVRTIFIFDEWEEDVYTCQLEMTLFDGTIITSPEGKLTLMPLPENLVLEPVKINPDKTFTFTATYDGEDKTVSKATFTLFDNEMKIISEAEGHCENRAATLTTEPFEYGRYHVSVGLDLVDGTRLEVAPISIVHAKPRAYETFEMTYDDMKAAGWAVDAASCEDVTMITCKGYNWEYQDIYVRYNGGRDYIYISSSKKGYIYCTSPFELGIKKVYAGFYQSKTETNFECWAKEEASGEWEKMPVAVKEGTVFTYDLSGGNYKYFKFGSLAKQEMRSDYFKVEYYTEPYVEY